MSTTNRCRFRLLATVKAYPSISTKYAELVCCAGITEHYRWVRLYPVPYRSLPNSEQFKKYDIITVEAERREAYKDDRPESWKPILDTMEIKENLGTGKNRSWEERIKWIQPTILNGYAELTHKQQADGTSLGAYRPNEIKDVIVESDERNWTKEQEQVINQKDLFAESKPLEKVPYRWKVVFSDENNKDHKLSIIDWEFFELWRKQRDKHQSEEKAALDVKQKIESILSPKNDTVFYSGNLGNRKMRKTFMILGFCYPKIEPQLNLL